MQKQKKLKKTYKLLISVALIIAIYFFYNCFWYKIQAKENNEIIDSENVLNQQSKALRNIFFYKRSK